MSASSALLCYDWLVRNSYSSVQIIDGRDWYACTHHLHLHDTIMVYWMRCVLSIKNGFKMKSKLEHSVTKPSTPSNRLYCSIIKSRSMRYSIYMLVLASFSAVFVVLVFSNFKYPYLANKCLLTDAIRTSQSLSVFSHIWAQCSSKHIFHENTQNLVEISAVSSYVVQVICRSITLINSIILHDEKNSKIIFSQ